MLSKQQIFDKSINHLRRQVVPSKDQNRSGCLYLSEGGLTCSVGCLIPKGRRSPIFDAVGDSGVMNLVVERYGVTLGESFEFADALYAGGVDVQDKATLDLLEDLQNLHDSHGSFDHPLFELAAADLASRHGCTYTPREAACT